MHEIEGEIISFMILIHLVSVRWDTVAQLHSLAAIPSQLSFTYEAAARFKIAPSLFEMCSESSVVASVRWVDQTGLVASPDGRAVRSPRPQTPHAAAQHRSRAGCAGSAHCRSLYGR